MAKVVLTDSCFWLGLVDPSDQHHSSALEWADVVDSEGAILLFPWPCLYEVISTRLVRRRDRTLQFEQFIKRPQIQRLDDIQYWDAALDAVFGAAQLTGCSHALVDGIIREILKDINLRIDYMLTFNSNDFQDVCRDE